MVGRLVINLGRLVYMTDYGYLSGMILYFFIFIKIFARSIYGWEFYDVL